VDAVLAERIARHGFVARADASVAAAARRTTAVQAQDHPAARLGIRARARTLTDADVVAAGAVSRTVARTWLMRGTIHLVATDDLRWLVAVFGPAVERKYRTRWRQLGLTDDYLERVHTVLPAVLADGPRTRAEIVAGLHEHGVAVDFADPQAATHLLMSASCLGLVCRGGDRGRLPTFTLLDDWVPDAPAGPRGDDAVAELARRYFLAYSPATAADFGAWSGLASSRPIALSRDELTPCDVNGRPGFRLGTPAETAGAGVLRLLPAFDNYLLGHKDRPFIDDSRRGEVYVGGVIRPTILLDGRVVGRWDIQTGRDTVTVRAYPFTDWAPPVREALEEEVADIGRFLGRPATLVLP
jgi:hypothetical protein